MKIYIIKLVKKWYIYLGLLPIFYDFISAYFALEFHLSNETTLLIIILTLLYSSYRVWKDEYEKGLNNSNIEQEFHNVVELINEIKILLKGNNLARNNLDNCDDKLNYLIYCIETLYKKNNLDNSLNDIIINNIDRLLDFIQNTKLYDISEHTQDEVGQPIYPEDIKSKNMYLDKLMKIQNKINK